MEEEFLTRLISEDDDLEEGAPDEDVDETTDDEETADDEETDTDADAVEEETE